MEKEIPTLEEVAKYLDGAIFILETTGIDEQRRSPFVRQGRALVKRCHSARSDEE